jgi:hypothetical protein
MRSSARLFSSLPEKAQVPALSKYLFELLSTLDKIDGELDVVTLNKLKHLLSTVSSCIDDSILNVDLPATVTLDNKHFDNTDIQYHHWSARSLAKSLKSILEENAFEPKDLHANLTIVVQSVADKKAFIEVRTLPDFGY